MGGPVSRRQREREHTRESILTAAQDIAAQHGWRAVTVRKIAERIEYSPGAIYPYFDSKDGILHELLRRGFETLGREVAKATQASGKPMVALVDAVWHFAAASPELYQVMHGLSSTPFGQGQAPAEAKRVFESLLAVLKTEAPGASRAQLEDAADCVWAAVHGFISLEMAGRLAGNHERAVRLSQRTVADLATALKVRTSSSRRR